MLDRILVTIAMALLIAFLGTVVVFVKEIDLTMVIALVVAMAIYEIWTELNRRRNGDGRGSGD